MRCPRKRQEGEQEEHAAWHQHSLYEARRHAAFQASRRIRSSTSASSRSSASWHVGEVATVPQRGSGRGYLASATTQKHPVASLNAEGAVGGCITQVWSHKGHLGHKCIRRSNAAHAARGVAGGRRLGQGIAIAFALDHAERDSAGSWLRPASGVVLGLRLREHAYVRVPSGAAFWPTGPKRREPTLTFSLCVLIARYTQINMLRGEHSIARRRVGSSKTLMCPFQSNRLCNQLR